MPRFAANLSMLFTEVPFLDRFERAARAGFSEVEFLFPYAHSIAELKAVLAANRLKLVLHNMPAGVSDAALRETYVSNLRFAAGEAERAGVKLLIEPINHVDMPGYYLNRSALALAVIDEVGSDNLYLQYDIYHMQRMEGELAATIEKHLARIAHIQLADTPGRHEPGTGEINYPFLFAHLDRIGYRGAIGCEYKPAASTEAGLGWLATARTLG